MIFSLFEKVPICDTQRGREKMFLTIESRGFSCFLKVEIIGVLIKTPEIWPLFYRTGFLAFDRDDKIQRFLLFSRSCQSYVYFYGCHVYVVVTLSCQRSENIKHMKIQRTHLDLSSVG